MHIIQDFNRAKRASQVLTSRVCKLATFRLGDVYCHFSIVSPVTTPIDDNRLLVLMLMEMMGSSVLSRIHNHILLFIDDNSEPYAGRYVFGSPSRRRRDFYIAVGETPETFKLLVPNLEPPVRERQPEPFAAN